jgi:hypothetical protein
MRWSKLNRELMELKGNCFSPYPMCARTPRWTTMGALSWGAAGERGRPGGPSAVGVPRVRGVGRAGGPSAVGVSRVRGVVRAGRPRGGCRRAARG